MKTLTNEKQKLSVTLKPLKVDRGWFILVGDLEGNLTPPST